MLSFGELKNNLKRLEDLNKHMNIFVKIGWSKNALDQKQIKNQPIEFYLRIIHYVLIQYSTQLYKAILDMIPNIKALSDQKFVQSCFTISRKILNINPKITADQFLQPSKLMEKKIQFIVQLSQNIQKWESSNRKKTSKETKGTNQLKNYMQQPVSLKSYVPPSYDDQDQDQLMEREITVKPTQFIQPLQHSFAKNNQEKRGSLNRQTVTIHNKPNVFPKNLQNQLLDEQDDNQFTQTAKFHQQKKIEPHIHKNFKQTKPVEQRAQESTEYVSKQQFNQVLEMLANINGTVNGLVSKFNNFQMNVTTWFNNTNARIVLLQQNVKMIKSNL